MYGLTIKQINVLYMDVYMTPEQYEV